MDKFDQLILQHLQQDARIAISELASLVHLSRSAVTERIKKLEQRGIIAGYQVLINTPQVSVKAYLEIQHSAASCQLLLPLFAAIPEVRQCHGISGEVDIMLFIEADSVARLHSIREQIDADPQVKRVKTHMVLSEWLSR